MAYMSKEHAKEIRNDLKKEFPSYKFSVKIHHHSSINVSLMKSPLDFSQDLEKAKPWEYLQLNEFHLEWYQNADVLKRIRNIVNKKNWDKSDIMTDYFNVGFYFHFNIGQYDKPYEQIK